MPYKKDLAEFISIADGARLIKERAGLPEDESREDIVLAVRERTLAEQWWCTSRGERSRRFRGDLPHGFLDNLTPDLIDWERSIARRRGVGAQFKVEIEVSRAGICHLWPDLLETPPGQGNSRQIATIAAETRCKNWLIELMSKDGPPDRPKPQYRSEAKSEYSVGTRAFDRAWQNAIAKTGNSAWSNPGRKS